MTSTLGCCVLRAGAVIALTVGLSACGGSDDAQTAPDSTTTTAAAADTDAGADAESATTVTEPASDEGDAAPPAGSAVGMMQIGEERFDLTVVRCITMGGAVGGDAVGVDDPDNLQASFFFSPEDWRQRPSSEGWTEDGTLRIDSDEPYWQWESGQSTFEGFNLPSGLDPTMIDIVSYDIADDGGSVRGEAMFLELNEMLSGTMVEPVAGSFEFSCPPSG